MIRSVPDKSSVLDAIRQVAQVLGHPPSRAQFEANTSVTEYQVLRYFPSWREAVRAAGLEPDATNVKLDDSELLSDWGKLVRANRQIPTRDQYKKQGKYSSGVFEKHFGPWLTLPSRFRDFAEGKSEWTDVLALLPPDPKEFNGPQRPRGDNSSGQLTQQPPVPTRRHSGLQDRPTYGNPIDFRGLRHEPVNEQGVVFLFGMVARELGYMVEAVQQGFPDCEAKRQIEKNKWQRVRIEFEFESRTFRDHGHSPDGCDVIVCWHHNWPDRPENLEVVELQKVIQSLAKSED